ncbi:GHMP kinase [Candidatus Woesearchaeota archaeon]|nr:GHMP kinase [Candidatus Woesearchaeota archaeon]
MTMLNIHEKLVQAKEQNKLPQITVFNRIDGPGSSLDLRLFQETFWKFTPLPKDLTEDPSRIWSASLPRTIGMSINIGTDIIATPIDQGKLGVESLDFGFSFTFDKDAIPPKKEYWLLKLMQAFDLDGVKFTIRNKFPELKSAGLGGSAALTTGVCLLANKLKGNIFSMPQIIGMASLVEEDLGVSITGTQEQSCAVYGGIRDYIWFPWGLPLPGQQSLYGTSLQQELLNPSEYQELREHIDVYFTAERHSSDVNSKWVAELKTTNGYLLHKQKCHLAYEFREAIRTKNWKALAQPIEEYRKIRTQLCSYYMSDSHNELKAVIQQHNAVCFPMGGGGGSVLVYAENPQDLKNLRPVLCQKFRYLDFEFIPYGHAFQNAERF